jgi:hypothetical protein
MNGTLGQFVTPTTSRALRLLLACVGWVCRNRSDERRGVGEAASCRSDVSRDVFA